MSCHLKITQTRLFERIINSAVEWQNDEFPFCFNLITLGDDEFALRDIRS
jgi:hypothetical protein